jgi:prepilin-type N-terminal cleavage/methylation domain-containing protein
MERRRMRGDEGFSLVEIMAALLVLGLAAAAIIPVLIIGTKAGHFAKLNTQAKNLTQERFERMRDLQFHVEKQNGDFVDLLDQYYTNRSTTAVTRTYGSETLSGVWVNSGTPLPGEPAVPFYRVTIDAIDGYPEFSQTVTTQFLQVSGTAVPASLFPNYDSQVEANDGPPSLIVGVTVVTNWTQAGSSKSYRAYTRIADSRGSVSTLTSQGKGALLKVSSGAPDLRALSAEVGLANADGSQTTGSIATASGTAGTAKDSTDGTFEVANGVATSPVTTSSNTGPLSRDQVGDGACGWASFGASEVTNVSASITNGVPQVPSNVDTATPPANQVTAGLYANGSNTCGLFGFNNYAVGGQSSGYDPALGLVDSDPLVYMSSTGGSTRLATGSAWVNATDSVVSNPHTVTSGAGASSTRQIEIFPGLWFVNGGTSRGLVNVTLNSATIRCTTSVTVGSAAVQSVAAAYNVTVEYWRATNTSGGGQWVSNTYTWSGAASADPLASLDPATIEVYNNSATGQVLHLSDYISSWSLTRTLRLGATNGVYSLDNVFALATVPVRSAGVPDPTSSVGVEIGSLSCAADDTR